jgi:hypothetical protein
MWVIKIQNEASNLCLREQYTKMRKTKYIFGAVRTRSLACFLVVLSGEFFSLCGLEMETEMH